MKRLSASPNRVRAIDNGRTLRTASDAKVCRSLFQLATKNKLGTTDGATICARFYFDKSLIGTQHKTRENAANLRVRRSFFRITRIYNAAPRVESTNSGIYELGAGSKAT